MNEEYYNWKRLWYPQDADLRLADGGMLDEPGYGGPEPSPTSKLRTLEQLNEPCLILLGEPGLGKSQALQDLEGVLPTDLATGVEVLHADLKGLSDVNNVHSKLFSSDTFKYWYSGNHRLFMLIDSLDETLLRLERLDHVLTEAFHEELGTILLLKEDYDALCVRFPGFKASMQPRRGPGGQLRLEVSRLAPRVLQEFEPALRQELRSRLPAARLYLRLACRTVDWRDSFQGLEQELKKLWWWAEGLVGVYVLAPLRWSDVVEAARAQTTAPKDFLLEVQRADATPLASKPITLKFLLDSFNRGGRLPSTQHELYEEGCRMLAREEGKENAREQAYRRLNRLSGPQRLAVAARLAAAVTFSGRPLICLSDTVPPPAALSLRELSGGREPAGGNEVQVDEQSIKDALATALFTSAGAERMRFAHQTYSEFLAAYYLAKQRGFSLKQKLQLLIHPHDPQGKVVPQFREVATWLASMDSEFRRELLQREPDLLMRADLASLGQEERRVLIEQLFKHQEAVTHWPIIYSASAQARNLVYPGLDALLRHHLRSGAHRYTRVLVVMLAESAECKSFQEDLLEVALAAGEDHVVRGYAVQALAQLGSSSTIAKLLPLARGQSGEDPDDELKASSLKLLWRQQLIGVDELLECLSPPSHSYSIGQYASLFLKSEVWDSLTPEGLRKTLVWLTKKGSWAWFKARLISNERIGCFLTRARNHIDTPGMFEANLQPFLRVGRTHPVST